SGVVLFAVVAFAVVVLLRLHERVPIIRRRRKRLLDVPGAHPAHEIELRPRLVVSAGTASSAKRLLPDHRAGRLVVDVEIAGRIAERERSLADSSAVRAEHPPRQRVWRRLVDDLQCLPPPLVRVYLRRPHPPE